MAANVENMKYVGQVPWHGLGNELPNEVYAQDAIVPAGLNWTVEKKPIFAQVEGVDFRPVDKFYATVRSSDNRPLGVVKEKYEPIQNQDVAELADVLTSQFGPSCHTAGSLLDGQKIWFLMKLPGVIRINKDPSEIEKYLFIRNASFVILLHSVRVAYCHRKRIGGIIRGGNLRQFEYQPNHHLDL